MVRSRKVSKNSHKTRLKPRRSSAGPEGLKSSSASALEKRAITMYQSGAATTAIAKATGLSIRRVLYLVNRSGKDTGAGRLKPAVAKLSQQVAGGPSSPGGQGHSTAWVRVPQPDEVPEEVQALFAKFLEKTGLVPNVAKNFALLPEHFLRWFRYYDFLMRSEGQLSHKEREMIALVVSAENRCEYCLASHSAYLRELTGDAILPDVLVANFRRAELSSRERVLLEFAWRMTKDSANMSEADLSALRAVGLSDEAIFEAAQVAAMFNFTNRLANALGWKPNVEYYSAHR